MKKKIPLKDLITDGGSPVNVLFDFPKIAAHTTVGPVFSRPFDYATDTYIEVEYPDPEPEPEPKWIEALTPNISSLKPGDRIKSVRYTPTLGVVTVVYLRRNPNWKKHQ